MPTDYGNVGRGHIYNDSEPPDLPRMTREEAFKTPDDPKKEIKYGFDWPGIGPPPRRGDPQDEDAVTRKKSRAAKHSRMFNG